LTLDADALRPLVAAVVRETLAATESAAAKLGNGRLGMPEGEAAAALGVARHVLRDARLRGEVQARKLGKSYCYSVDSLRRWLASSD